MKELTTYSNRRAGWRVWAVLVVLIAGGLVYGSPAVTAHSVLVSSQPAAGQRLETSPAEIQLTFNEAVSLGPQAVKVFAATGQRVDQGEPTVDAQQSSMIRSRLSPALPQGLYTVVWRVGSADSHVASGSFTFGIGQDAAIQSDAPIQVGTDQAVLTLLMLARGLAYLAVIVWLGGMIFRVSCVRGHGLRTQVWIPRAGLTLLVASFAQLWLQAPYTAGENLTALVSPAALAHIGQTRLGQVLILRLVLVAVMLAWWPRWSRQRGWQSQCSGLAAALILLFTWSGADHAATGRWAALTLPADLLHLAAAIVWLGGLGMLLGEAYAFRGQPARLGMFMAGTMRRFSPLAAGSVVTIVLTGVLQSWIQLGSWSAFIRTEYGVYLVIKVLVFAAMLLVALAIKRYRFSVAPVRQLLLESGLGVVVIVVTVLLTQTSPAKNAKLGADTADRAGLHQVLNFDVGTVQGRGQVRLSTSSAHSGSNQIVLAVAGSDGEQLPLQEIKATLAAPELGIDRIDLALVADSDHFTTRDLVIPSPGQWTVSVTIRVSDLDQTTVRGTLAFR